MDTRTLGSQGLAVSEQGLGCMGMSEFYGATDEGEAIATIHRALELGVTFIDTADMYGPFTNEKLVGKALAGRRDDAVIATKFGNVRGEDGSFNGIRGDAEYVRSACDASLQRLGIDTIDLYYQHRVDPVVPIEETVGAMAELVQEGKVRYLGLSEAGAETIRRAARGRARSPRCRASTRCSSAASRRRSSRPSASWASASSPTPRSAAASSPARIRSHDDLDENDCPPPALPALRAREPPAQPRPRREARNDRRAPRAARRASSRSRGSSAAATTSSRSRERSAARASRRTPAPPTSSSTTTTLAELEEAFPPGVAAGDRYAEAGMQSVER